MKAIETTGFLEKSGQLKLDKPLKTTKKQKVKIIILYSEDTDEISDSAWLTSLYSNPAFEFLKNKEEDIYSLKDGKPAQK